ncbi:hypothetical protein VPH35_059499 [Triticum aestivum]
MKLSLNYWSDASTESVTITILEVETRITSRAPALCCAGDERVMSLLSMYRQRMSITAIGAGILWSACLFTFAGKSWVCSSHSSHDLCCLAEVEGGMLVERGLPLVCACVVGVCCSV